MQTPSTFPTPISDSAIAIIGMAGRFPGAKNLDHFWENLANGVESESPLSESELLAQGVDAELLADSHYVRWDSHLEDVDQFDASLFEFSPQEAAMADPQQRIFLECAWEALENSGYSPKTHDNRIGIYAGYNLDLSYLHDYVQPRYHLSNHDLISSPLGISAYVNNFGLSTRVAYKLNLTGPAVDVATACSTSLVAVHLACNSLRSGDCEMALAGGVSIRFPQKMGYLYQEGMILSPDGHCHTFDATAQGTVWADAAGIVVLKKLKDAIADGDYIHAVIKGSAINNDGHLKFNYTEPSVDGQAAVITAALKNAQVSAETIDYIEAHGTGTTLGDPVEIKALTKAFRASTNRKQFCAIGSVKTNIGHSIIAAGIVGLIKTVLALEHRQIPPSLNYKSPNPHINFARSPFYVNTELTDWNTDGHPRRAGISSLGFGGTNAHLILEEAPSLEVTYSYRERPLHLFTLSAQTQVSLKHLSQDYLQFLETHTEVELADLTYTANLGREHFGQKLAAITQSKEQLKEQLQGFINDQPVGGLITGSENDSDSLIVFLFTGQGSQSVGMGRQLYETQPTFRACLHRCDEILRDYLEEPLLSVLYPESEESSLIDQTLYTQPALFAIEYALAQLWQSWGIKPDAVMGHSVGEYVAACLAGVFSLEAALKLIAHRARLMQALPANGAMVAVLATPEVVELVIKPRSQAIAIAAVNGPNNVVISGLREEIEQVVELLTSQGIKTTYLKVSHGFHSPLMAGMLADFAVIAQEITYQTPKIPLISNVTGEIATEEIANADYWCRHIGQPVKFAASMATLEREGYQIFLECGAKPTLLGMARQCLPDGAGIWLPSLRPTQDDWSSMLTSLAELFGQGVAINWPGFERDYLHHRIPLPTYHFEQQSYLLKPLQHNEASPVVAGHPLLGQRLKLPFSPEIRFENQLSPNYPAYLGDHRLYGTVVVPGASHLAMALLATQAIFGHPAGCLEDVVFTQAITLPEQETRLIQLVFMPQDQSFQIISLSDPTRSDETDAWQVHVKGKLQSLRTAQESLDLPSLKANCPNYLAGEEFYRTFWDAGYTLGSSFQWIDHIWQGETSRLCQMRVPQLQDNLSDYPLYPGLIDSCFQFLLVDIIADLIKEDYLYVPFAIHNFRFYDFPNIDRELWCYTSLIETNQGNSTILTGDITLCDKEGHIIAKFEKLEARKASRQRLLAQGSSPTGPSVREGLYQVSWQPQARENMTSLSQVGTWLVFADAEGLGIELMRRLKEKGHHCLVVFPGTTYQQISKEQYIVNPIQPQDFQQLLTQISADYPLPLEGIVHLWSLTEKNAPDLSASAFLETQRLSCGSVLSLLQAIAAGWAQKSLVSPRLWLLTQDTQPIGENLTCLRLEQTPLWGLGRVLAVEHPELKCVRLDLASEDNLEVETLLAEILMPDSENEIALRQGVRYVPRLRPSPQPSPAQSPAINGQSTYLITGGLGALGLQVASWMAQQGAKHLVLTGRSEASTQAQEIIDQIEQSGTQVTIIKSDIAVPEEVSRLLTEIAATSQAPLRGIIHAAGVLDDGILLQMSWERLAKVLAPKMQGSWNLHQLTRDLPLDFFVCFSSISSLIGNPGQGNYAAANAFMDGLSHYRSSLGLASLTINWGPWMSGGMATQVQELLAAKGLSSMTPEQGLSILGELLSLEIPQIAVAPVKWTKFLAQFPSGEYPSLLRQLTKVETVSSQNPNLITLRQQLEQVPQAKRRALLIAHVRSQVAQVIGLQETQLRDLLIGFQDLGIDSLMAVELRNRLQSSLSCSLPPTLAFNYPNIEAVTNYLIEQVLSSLFVATENKTEATVNEGMVAKVQQLSDEDLELLILKKLDKLNQ